MKITLRSRWRRSHRLLISGSDTAATCSSTAGLVKARRNCRRDRRCAIGIFSRQKPTSQRALLASHRGLRTPEVHPDGVLRARKRSDSYLTGFSPDVRAMQDATRIGTPQQRYWASGTASLLDLQAAHDPYRPRSTADELVNEFGRNRVTVVVIPDSSHAIPIERRSAVADALVTWAGTLPAQPAGPAPAP